MRAIPGPSPVLAILGCVVGGLVVAAALAQEEPVGKLFKRHGFEPNLNQFPQKNPKEALQAVVKALESKRVNYLVAQLADPVYIDGLIAEYKKSYQQGPDEAKSALAFDRLVREVTGYYAEDPQLLAELRRFAKEGEWEATDAKASAAVAALPGRKVFMKKLEGRWFLENRQQ